VQPRVAVARFAFSAETRAEGDQLGELGDRVDVACRGNANEPVRVEVVAEQERELVVRRCKEARASVVAEVALVDRLEPEREALVAEEREDGLTLGLGARGVGPERRLARRVGDDLVPEVND
jgi:hypothetical protein